MPEQNPHVNGHTRRRTVICTVLLLLLSLVPYLGGRQHAFVYDDHGQIVENPFLDAADAWHTVLTLQTLNDGAVVNGRRPLVLASYLLDQALWGPSPAGWRTTNYAVHGLGVVLLYWLVIRIRRIEVPRRPYHLFAFIAALLYAWHPALSEAVHVPAFRADLLVVCFVLFGLHAALWAQAAQTGPSMALRWSIFSGACAAALFSKESGVVLPFVLGCCWWCFPATRGRRGHWAVAVLVSGLVVAGYVVLCAWPNTGGAAAPPLQALGGEWNGRSLRFPDNLLTMPWLWWQYATVLLWPVPLIVDRVVVPVQSVGSLRLLWGGLWVLACLYVGWRVGRDRPWIRFALCWCVAGFVPVSNGVPLMNPMAERYMPLMVVGFALLVAWLLAGYGFGTGRFPRVRLALCGVLLVGYPVLTMDRVQDYRDDETLWRRTLADEPRSARAHTWVGLIAQRQQRWAEAIELFGKARVLNPHDVTPLINAALIYARSGAYDKAEERLREAVAIRPSFPPAHWALARVLQAQGRFAEALEVLSEVLTLDPYHVDALKARMVLLVDRGRYRQAYQDALHLLELAPSDPEAHAAKAYLAEHRHTQ